MTKMITLEGLEEAQKAFSRLGQAVKDATEKSALDRAGEVVRQDAHDKCSVKGGTSADGFYVSKGKLTARSGAVRKSIKYKVQGSQAKIGTDHILGPKLEFGTSRESPHPFMRRSADDPTTRKAVVDIFSDEIERAAKEVAK